MRFKCVYIYCPGIDLVTGGVELLHQLAGKLKANGVCCYMIYNGRYENSKVEKAYEHYDYNVSKAIEDSEENLLIAPESKFHMLYKYNRIQKAIWWESVDNYPASFKSKQDAARFIYHLGMFIYDKKRIKNYYHFAQSEYAREWLLSVMKIREDKIFSLSDYLNKSFINESINQKTTKENILLYSPKRGMEYTTQILRLLPKTIEAIALQGLTYDEVSSLMRKSKLYIDFGNHPGKDRMPREAAISGCCIITGMLGSARNSKDVNIPKEYKFNQNSEDINLVINKITDIFSDFDLHYKRFEDYRKKIINEEIVFDQELKEFFLR